METPNLDNLINDLESYDRMDMLSDSGRNQLNEYRKIKQALRIHDVVGQDEQLKALEELKEFAYNTCPPHLSDELSDIMERL